MQKDYPRKLIIIPAFNEEANIEKTVKDIEENAPEFDYIIINDCSTDKTRTICTQNNYNVIHLPINLGIGGAVQTGYIYGYRNGYDLAVQVDGDGQHDPAFLSKMADYMERSQADMVIGSRFIKKEGFQSSVARQMGIRYFTWLIRMLTGVRITDPTSGMRMVNRELIQMFAADYPKDYPEPESVMAILRMGKKVTEVPVVMKERKEGTSSIGGFRSAYYMIKVTLAILMERLRR